MHVFSAAAGDLASGSREQGFDNLDFHFDDRPHGVFWDGACLVAATLPDYEISHVRTGQFSAGEGQLWSAEIAVPAGE